MADLRERWAALRPRAAVAGIRVAFSRFKVNGWAAARRRAERARTVLYRLSAQLYGGIGVAVALTFVASLVAWFAFDRVGESQRRVNEDSIPQLAISFAAAQQGGGLAVAASRLIDVESMEELQQVSASIAEQRLSFESHLKALTGRSGERFDRVRNRGGALIANLNAIDRSAEQRFTLVERRAALDRQRLALERSLDGLPAAVQRRLAPDAKAALRHSSEALTASDGETLQSLRTRFEVAVRDLGRDVAALGLEGPASGAAASLARELSLLGRRDRGAFGLRAEELALDRLLQDLLAENRNLSSELLREIEGLVNVARQSAATAADASGEAIRGGRVVLIVINSISVVGAVLVAWLFVGRVLLRRLQRLSDRMRAMADGDLEAELDIGGRDEVAEMASALEVFRRHALEVQRLNLVEKLAEELKDRNGQLEDALAELRRAQDRIVATEKLAGLGELTAGVAHEIRNPLNFVNNFSDASEELLADLDEELGDPANGFTEPQKEVVGALCEEVVGNLQRIRRHGGRAERIVADMLRMGGGTGERRFTDINGLLVDQVGIAIRGVRETDPDFQLEVVRDLDPNAGNALVVPQDLGRVFQNLVLNACHAMGERRRLSHEADYAAALRLATRRFDEQVEVRIRDNGTGIPEAVVDKIFNPFFTTKPTGQGSGLGLSLCNDILRGHGGTIRVDTKPDSHTEVILDLPTGDR